MTKAEKDRLEELKWAEERRRIRIRLEERLKETLKMNSVDFLSFDKSNEIIRQGDSWPENKWTDSLFLQTQINNKSAIEKILEKYIELNTEEYVLVFFMNFNCGMVKICNQTLVNKWPELIEVDGDEIFCFIQNEAYFLCLEKTEDIMANDENKCRQWLYEVTFSNQEIKSKLS